MTVETSTNRKTDSQRQRFRRRGILAPRGEAAAVPHQGSESTGCPMGRLRRPSVIATEGPAYLSAGIPVVRRQDNDPVSVSGSRLLRPADVFVSPVENGQQDYRAVTPSLEQHVGTTVRVWRLPSASVRNRLVKHHGEGHHNALFGEFGSRENLNMAQTESSVALPKKYERYVRAKEINPNDLAFFETLLGRFGLAKKSGHQRRQNRQFGEAEFMTACEEVKTYVMDVRQKEMSNWNIDDETPLTVSRDGFLEGRQIGQGQHPADRRVQKLLLLFLHHPKIRAEYIKIHAQKMGSALPEFSEKLSAISDVDISDRSEYMEQVYGIMHKSMLNASYGFPQAKVDTLGLLMGYELKGGLPSTAVRRLLFANYGMSTFTQTLGQVIDKAVLDGEDVHAAVRREFLTNDGIGFILARTHVSDFTAHAEKAIFKNTLVQDWETVKSQQYGSGICPAIAKIPSQGGPPRPIMYEYAMSILRNMPERFLKGE